MDVDFKQIMDDFVAWINKASNAVVEFFKDPKTHINSGLEKTKKYFNSLTEYESYAWIGEGLGFVLIILAIIFW
jgi:hypothetical protein